MKKLIKKYKWFLLLGLVLILMNINFNAQPQTVAPECFKAEDCIVPLPKGYCGVKYDCVGGKCYSEIEKCPEICYGGKDEDLDNIIDCEDPDCFNSPRCPCDKVSLNDCYTGRCYCSSGTPEWIVAEDDHWCACT